MGNVLKKYNGTNWDIVGGAVTGDTLPIGAIMPYTSKTTPLNWLPCNGQAVSRTDYADLFAIIGTQYGEGDGSTTFNVPDLNDYKVPIGYDRFEEQSSRMNLGTTGGEEKHTLTSAEMPTHNHGGYVKVTNSSALALNGDSGGGDNFTTQINAVTNNATQFAEIPNSGGSRPHNNMQPYVTTNYIIKAFQSSGVVAQVSNTKSESTTDTYSCDYINGTVLFTGSNGSGNITLNENAPNYSRLKIYFHDVNNRYKSEEILFINDTDIDLSSFQTTTGNSRILNRVIHINNNLLTTVISGYVLFNTNERVNENDLIIIDKIVGFK